MKKVLLVACTLGLLPMAGHAQFAKPEDAIKYRRAAYTVMGAHFSRIGETVKGTVPYNAKETEANAALVEALAKLPFTAFGKGTESGDTRAKPEIWREADKFHAGAEKMQQSLTQLYAASKTGDLAQIRTAFGAAGQTCKACHDNYRSQ